MIKSGLKCCLKSLHFKKFGWILTTLLHVIREILYFKGKRRKTFIHLKQAVKSEDMGPVYNINTSVLVNSTVATQTAK